ncbi:hypothetical protein MMC30_003810 [Trapelia coarctata]|nr:hypothetical protein [Trapelia coarctata]
MSVPTAPRTLSQEGLQVKTYSGLETVWHHEKEVLGVVEGPLAVDEGVEDKSIAEGSWAVGNETPTARGGVARRPPRVWYICGAILFGLVVVIAVLGGVLGSRRLYTSTARVNSGNSDNSGGSLNSTNPSSNNSANPRTGSNNTRLASVSWKDTAGVRFDRIFYQDSNNNIRTSLFNSTHPVWHGSNISLAVARDRTPLAVAANSRSAPITFSLFFLNPVGQVNEIVSTDGMSWQNGSLNTQDILPANYTSLAAAFARNVPCQDCPSSLLFVYQDSDDKFRLWNSTEDGWANYTIPANPIAGSGVSLSPISVDEQPDELRLFYQIASGDVVNADWVSPSQLSAADPTLVHGAVPGWNIYEKDPRHSHGILDMTAPISSFVYSQSPQPVQNYGNVTGLPILVGCLVSGTSGITTTEWYPLVSDEYSVPSIQPPMANVMNYSAIASHSSGSAYAVQDGGIVEFVINPIISYNWFRKARVAIL